MQMAPNTSSNSKEPVEDPFHVLDFKNDLELKFKINKQALMSFY